MANYYITSVYKDATGVIINVILHAVNSGNQLLTGQKLNEGQVIALINANHIIYTLVWNYSTVSWQSGSLVTIVRSPNPYLRSTPDRLVRDNLDNLLPGSAFIN